MGLVSSGETVLPVGCCRNTSNIAPSSLFPSRRFSRSAKLCTGIRVIPAPSLSWLLLLLALLFTFCFTCPGDQPHAGFPPTSCREQMWMSSGYLPASHQHLCVLLLHPCSAQGPSLLSSHPFSPSLSSSLPLSI